MRTRAPLQRRAKPVIRDLFDLEPIDVDLFAGGGGASVGTEAASGKKVDVAVNHDPIAIAVHAANHPETRHYVCDVFEVDPELACGPAPVRHLHASPDCRHHSRASGGKPKSASVRSLADVVIIWAEKKRPDLITIENVPEFVEWGPLDEHDKPIKARKGEHFARWCGELRALGYVLEHRVLHAHHYGAPTSRKRFFLVARCDGKPIVWPEPTHGPGKKRYRTAAECIDWSLPCPSIFLDTAAGRVAGVKRPLADATLRRVAAGIVEFVLKNPQPFVVGCGGRAAQSPSRGVDQPLGTITTKNDRCLVAPTMVQTSYGERKGQAPRVLDLHKPLGTIVAGGVKHALVESLLAPFLSQYNQGQVGHELTKPLPTITAIDHHALVSVQLASPEFAAQYPHARHVLPFLIAYYGSEHDLGQLVTEPLRTITTKERFALVTVEVDGATYAIVDIGMRMLRSHELLRAQFGRFAASYDLSEARTEKHAVRLIGNSVCPEMQEAVVAANLPPSPRRRRPRRSTGEARAA